MEPGWMDTDSFWKSLEKNAVSLRENGKKAVYLSDVEQLRTKVTELQSSHDALKAALDYYRSLEPVVWWNENTCQFFIGDILDVERRDLFKPLYALEKMK